MHLYVLLLNFQFCKFYQKNMLVPAMKKGLFFILISCFWIIGKSQNQNIFLNNVPTLKKGKITFVDGNSTRYTNLNFQTDYVTFYDSTGLKKQFPLDEVNLVTKSKSLLLTSTGIGLLVGFLGGIVVAGIAHPQRTVDEWLVDQIEGNEGPGISKEQWPIVGIGTACGTVVGAFTGLFLKKEKKIYEKPAVEVFPGLTFLPEDKNGFMITVKININ